MAGRLGKFGLAALLAALVGVFAAPAARTATNVEVVSGGVEANVNNLGPPSFTPTGANSKIGVNQINAQLATQDVTLDTSPNNSQSGNITVSAAITSSGTGDLILDADDDTAGGGISQTAPITVGDVTARTEIDRDVNLTNGANDFNTIGGQALRFDVTDVDGVTFAGLALGINVSTINAGGDVNQTGPITGQPTLDFDVGTTRDITLTDPANDIGGLQVDHASDVTYRDSTSMVLFGTDLTGNLSLTATGTVFDSPSYTIAVDGTSTLSTANNRDFLLDNPSNDFGGAVSVVSAEEVTLADANALAMDTSTISRIFIANAAGAITQSGAVFVGETTSLAAGSTNDITLDNSLNNFVGAVSVQSGRDVSLRDANALGLGASTVSSDLSLTTAGAITQAGALGVTDTTTLAAGSGNDITLTAATNSFGGAVEVTSGRDVSLRDGNALGMAASTVSSDFSATAAGPITQSGALAVTDTTTLTAGSANNITLTDVANEFGGPVAVVSGNNVSLRDASALALGASAVSGNFSAQANATLAQGGGAAVTGTSDLTGSPVTLNDSNNDFGARVRVTSTGAGAASINDTNNLILGTSTSGGSLTATADDDLTVPGFDVVQATGSLRMVADGANPVAPGIGNGGITAGPNATLSGAGAIGLYAARRGDNSIAPTAIFNGSTFTPGTIFVDSAREQWGEYFPGGTSTAPFTFFYKDTDASSPTASVTTPANGATFERGQTVNADYSCTDGGGGSGVTKCQGTVPDGSPVDTATLGQKTFKVEAESGSGGTTTTTVSYTVVDRTKPTITLTSPEGGASYTLGEQVAANYSCADETAVARCEGTVADGAAIDTGSAGTKSFTVEATDGSGNRAVATATYTVGHPAGDFEITSVLLNEEDGTATLTVNANGPGSLQLKKTNKLKSDGPVTLDAAGTAELQVVTRKGAARRLAESGRLKVNPKVHFYPAGGGEIGKRREITLRLRQAR